MAELEPVLSKGQIAKRVRELGLQLTMDYTGRDLILIGILNGAFVFLADLMRAIELPLEVEFFGVASYGASDTSSGTIRITKDTERSVEGLDVLLVEDIVDSGRTLALEQRQTGSNRRASWEDLDRDGVIDPGETVYWAWNTGGHANTLIPLFAQGRGSDRLVARAQLVDPVRGAYLDNTDLAAVLRELLRAPR